MLFEDTQNANSLAGPTQEQWRVAVSTLSSWLPDCQWINHDIRSDSYTKCCQLSVRYHYCFCLWLENFSGCNRIDPFHDNIWSDPDGLHNWIQCKDRCCLQRFIQLNYWVNGQYQDSYLIWILEYDPQQIFFKAQRTILDCHQKRKHLRYLIWILSTYYVCGLRFNLLFRLHFHERPPT